jgi:penicillin-binding protein 2A
MPLKLNMIEGSSDGWFTDAVLEEASGILAISTDDVLTSGYSIYTFFEPSVQQAADDLFLNASNFPDDAADGTQVQAALVAMDPSTGAVRALIGGRSYSVRRGLNRATQMKRSPGSAIKPVSTYAAAIDAHQTHALAILENKGGVAQHLIGAKALLDALQGKENHGIPPVSNKVL